MNKIVKIFRGIPKKTMISLLALVTIINYFVPLTTVFAINQYVVSFSAEGTHTMTVDEGHLKIDGQYVDLVNNSNVSIGQANCTSSTSCSITVGSGEAGHLNYNSGGLFTLYNTNGHTAYDNGNLSSNTVFLVEDSSSQNDYEDIDVNFTFTGTTGEVKVNETRAGSEGSTWSGTVENAGFTDNTKTNKIYVTTSFGEPKVSTITINGVDYNFTDGADEHMIEVAGASSYTITATADNTIAQDRTIIWANVGAEGNDEFPEDMILTHGSARVIEVKNKNGEVLNPASYIGENSDNGGLDVNGYGWVHVAPESTVTFEFVPEYGYQLTSVKANGFDLEPQDTINQYEFVMPNTNVHFSAIFKKTSDVVDAGSTKVKSGSINLGNNNLDGGSAILTVNDVQLDNNKIKGFENAAKDYSVSTFLDIDLYNVFYKGKDDSEDVWSEKIDSLNKEATISIKLENGVNGNDIVIVHNIHDGDEYEIIPTTYDARTNTITFKTKSFSNYAIASKITNSTNPKTGSNIMMYFTMFFAGLIGLVCSVIISNRFLDNN